MAKTSPVLFFRQVAQEISKVTWPTKKETWITAVMVVTLVFVAAIFFSVVDVGLGHVMKIVLGFGG